MVDGSDTSTVSRVAAVLRVLGADSEHAELTGSEIARRVGRERSQISRMLKALAAEGLVEQNPETRAYRVGWQLYTLAAKAGDQRLVRHGAPILRAVVDQTGETALLSVLQAGSSFTVLREASRHALQAGGWVGRISPLHASASGRALLLDLSDDEIGEVANADIGQDGLGPRAVRTAAELLERLRAERAAGCSVAVDELEEGLASVAVPVRDATNKIIASLNVSGPTFRIVDRVSSLTVTTKAAAAGLAALIARTAVPDRNA